MNCSDRCFGKGRTCLYVACRYVVNSNKRMDIVELLLARGAKVRPTASPEIILGYVRQKGAEASEFLHMLLSHVESPDPMHNP